MANQMAIFDHVSKFQCPICKCGVSISHDKTGLTCSKCNTIFPIIDGIARFTSDHDSGFDERWIQYRKPQPTTASVFAQKTGGWSHPQLHGKTVLDAGCGIGRFSMIARAYGADVFSVDASPAAVKSAYENTGKKANVVQADILNLPFCSQAFDMAFSIGVLHHTKNTKDAFMEVARTVKPGGQLAVWLYCNPALDPAAAPAIDFLHDLTRAVPSKALFDICKKHAVALRDSYHPKWDALQQVIRPSYHPDNDECISDFFDWHAPAYRYWHTDQELTDWFKEAGFSYTKLEFPVSAVGTKIK